MKQTEVYDMPTEIKEQIIFLKTFSTQHGEKTMNISEKTEVIVEFNKELMELSKTQTALDELKTDHNIIFSYDVIRHHKEAITETLRVKQEKIHAEIKAVIDMKE